MLESNRRCPLRIHCQRMFLHEDDIRLLPDWAFFIGGLIDSPALTPTAARDNFVDDAEAARIKTALGAAIVEHLLGLAASAPERLAAIVHRHDFGIKAACRNTQDLLPCLWDLLHWRVNDGRGTDPAQRRLPEILAQIPQDGDGVRDLPIFTQRDIGNPYFAMANAAGLTVIDASRGLDEDVLVRWAKGRRDVRLTRLDRDDSALVRRLDDADAAGFQPLAEATRRLLANHVDMPVTVEVRRFEPASLPVLFRIAAGNEGRARAEAVLGDSTAPADMREMAKSLLSLASQEASHFILNAANPLVRKLAHADIGDGDVAHVLIALFEGALLGGQEILTAEAASHFRQGFHHLLERHLHLADAARGYEPPVTPLASIWPRRHVVH